MSVPAQTVPPRELPANLNNERAPVWMGMVLMLTIEATVFATLIGSYFYLRFNNPEWPLGGIERPDLLLPSISTAILLISSLPVAWADRGGRQGDQRRLRIGLGAGFVLGAIFLALKVIEYSGYDYNWATNAYGSIVWLTIGFHGGHVLTLLLKTGVVLAASLRGHFTEERNLGIGINGLYWHFVVIVWIPLFMTLYLSHLVL